MLLYVHHRSLCFEIRTYKVIRNKWTLLNLKMEYFKINIIVNAFTIEIAGFRFVLEVLEAIIFIFFKITFTCNFIFMEILH